MVSLAPQFKWLEKSSQNKDDRQMRQLMWKLEIAKGTMVIGLLVMMVSNFIKYIVTPISCSADDDFGEIITPEARQSGIFFRLIIILLLILWTSLQIYSVRSLKTFKEMPWEEIQN